MIQVEQHPGWGFAPLGQSADGPEMDTYGEVLSQLVVPGKLNVRSNWPQHISVKACKLIGGGMMTSIAVMMPIEVHHSVEDVSTADDDILITVAVEGSGTISQLGQELQYRAGDVIFRRADLPSTSAANSTTKVIVLRISKERFFGPYVRYAENFIPVRADAASALAGQVQNYLLRVLPGIPSSNSVVWFLAEQSLIALLGAIYCESAEVKDPRHSQGDRWKAVVAYLDANLGDPHLSVQTICTAVGVSKRLFHKLFEARGLRYSHYLLRRRLERAREQLRSQKLVNTAISEIGYRCGFVDPSHFSRSFREEYGCTPREFRQESVGQISPVAVPL